MSPAPAKLASHARDEFLAKAGDKDAIRRVTKRIVAAQEALGMIFRDSCESEQKRLIELFRKS